MFLSLGILEVFSRIDWANAFLPRIMQKWFCIFLSAPRQGDAVLNVITLLSWLRWCLPGFPTMRLLFFTLLISKYLGEIRQDHANILFLLQICPLILAFIGWFFFPHDCSVCQKAFQCCFLNRKLHESGHFICLLCLGSKQPFGNVEFKII